MKIYCLSSGSKGNATLVVCDNFNILIDAGTSKKYLIDGLKKVGYSTNDIDMLLVTHFHIDHCKSLNIFSNEVIYSYENDHKTLHLDIDNDFNGIKIKPFELSHDNRCIGYQIKFNDCVYTHITDTGYFKNCYLPYIKQSTHLYLEFNHDLEMLKQTNRPSHIKKRILSDKGHLNNIDAAIILAKSSDKLKEVFIAHISEDANTIPLIKDAIDEVFNEFEKDITFDIKYTSFQNIVIGGNYEN